MRCYKKTGLFLLSYNLIVSVTWGQSDSTWTIYRAEWDAPLIREYEEFVRSLGESRCRSVNQCLKGPGNPYRASDDPKAQFFSDCADWPYTLLGYFAWKKGLPFAYASQVTPVGGSSSTKEPPRRRRWWPFWGQGTFFWQSWIEPADIRYSRSGNTVTARTDFTSMLLAGKNPVRLLNEMTWAVSTAMFRLHPNTNLKTLSSGQVVSSDFYPVEISRDAIRPGTVFYDPSGHVAVVYKIGDDGRIYMFDAHPDQSITYIQFGEKFQGSRPEHGAGFKNFRPLRLTGFQRDSGGRLLGGKIVPRANEELALYSQEQYLHPRWKEDRWSFEGRNVNFYEWVRARLSTRGQGIDLLDEFKESLMGLCQDVQDRVLAVELAVKQGLHLKNTPSKYPNNIYGTSGEWEEFSTPSRDARLKAYAAEIRSHLESWVEAIQRGDSTVRYSGVHLKTDLLAVYREVEGACTLAYVNSAGQPVSLTLTEVLNRLYRLSYNPYHCPELRWGARSSSAEFASCRDSDWDLRWYEAEQRLRNQVERTYDLNMAFSLEDLQRRVPGSGVDQGPRVDIYEFLLGL
jgi:hypothetical protein